MLLKLWQEFKHKGFREGNGLVCIRTIPYWNSQWNWFSGSRDKYCISNRTGMLERGLLECVQWKTKFGVWCKKYKSIKSSSQRWQWWSHRKIPRTGERAIWTSVAPDKEESCFPQCFGKLITPELCNCIWQQYGSPFEGLNVSVLYYIAKKKC